MLWPEKQKKAQEEIDAVVGRGRLPSFDDLDKLVYIRAMVKETKSNGTRKANLPWKQSAKAPDIRWHTVAHEGCYLHATRPAIEPSIARTR